MFIDWQTTNSVLGSELAEAMGEVAAEDRGLPMALVIRAFKTAGDELGPTVVGPVLSHFLMALHREVQTLRAEGYEG
jgi:hypothetical protein